MPLLPVIIIIVSIPPLMILLKVGCQYAVP
jgi:hypothetical protein